MKPAPVSPVSPDDRIAFEAYLLAWQDRLGLQDWRIRLAKKNASAQNMAEAKIFHVNRMANIFLGRDFGGAGVSPQTLEATALHELLHVFLCELVNQTEYGIDGEPLQSAEHRVIHVLEKLLLKGD